MKTGNKINLKMNIKPNVNVIMPFESTRNQKNNELDNKKRKGQRNQTTMEPKKTMTQSVIKQQRIKENEDYIKFEIMQK